MKDILYRLFEHQYLGRDEARTILQNIAEGKYNDSQIASLITVYLMRNISVEELAGFREAFLEMRVPVDLSISTGCAVRWNPAISPICMRRCSIRH